MSVYREVVSEKKDGVIRCALIRVETDVGATVYESYEVIVTSYEEWSGDYTKSESESYYVRSDVGEARAEYDRIVFGMLA